MPSARQLSRFHATDALRYKPSSRRRRQVDAIDRGGHSPRYAVDIDIPNVELTRNSPFLSRATLRSAPLAKSVYHDAKRQYLMRDIFHDTLTILLAARDRQYRPGQLSTISHRSLSSFETPGSRF